MSRTDAAVADNVGSWLEIRARSERDRVAIVDGRRSLTYGELAERSSRVAGALVAAGVGRGDRVAVALKNRTEFVELLFGTARIGAIFVPLNFRLSADELAFVLADAEPKLVFAQAQTVEAVSHATSTPVIDVDDSAGAYAQWLERAERGGAVELAADEPLTIIYTSGSTGNPKGVVLTHDNVSSSVVNYLVEWDLRRDDVTLVVNPLFHVVLYILTVPLLVKGGTVVLLEDFSADEALRLVVEHGVTVWFAIPTSWQAIVDSPSFASADLSRLRFVASGGAACPGHVMDALVGRGLPYRQGYGMTETTASGASMQPEDQSAKRGSVGRSFFNLEAKVVSDDGGELGLDAPGELTLRGRPIFSGYWNRPDATAEAFDGAWFRTGDIARIDADGCIWIVDRKKDIIISGGENIGTGEVEQAVLAHPLVRETAVVGVADSYWGEKPVAYVSLVPGAELAAEELIAHCRGLIAHYKCPKEVVVLAELPKTGSGKIDKAELRRRPLDLAERATGS